eukprot:CAMPEP_0202963392 /NCGR_PEP_ID=MMETSP1396-20130829/7384_1 /ASSEMBLY_ACC=CAM_ASM_000872 /TAXON_ID= /ORGANISM="Pseudokeronopsis sp., Strain Brazil" /LENGTH=65 /DNA_ID=CAMNT_0049684561 /DNA_START=357 /DNA_END=554 /DNA_ORIENTATION=-
MANKSLQMYRVEYFTRQTMSSEPSLKAIKFEEPNSEKLIKEEQGDEEAVNIIINSYSSKEYPLSP